MVDLIRLVIEIGTIISALAVTVYISKSNATTIKTKILPELEDIKVNLTAIKLHLAGVMELKKRSDEDHDKLVVLTEKAKGIQTGLTTVRTDFQEHVKQKHSKF